MNRTDQITTSKLAKRGGVNLETIRYYERKGLLPKPSTFNCWLSAVLIRQCTSCALHQTGTGTGFSLKEIKELLALGISPSSTRADVRKRAETKIVDIEEKVQHLRAMKKALVRLIESCCGNGPASDCPILESLSLDEKVK